MRTKLDIEVLSRFHDGLEDGTVWLNVRLVNLHAVALSKDISTGLVVARDRDYSKLQMQQKVPLFKQPANYKIRTVSHTFIKSKRMAPPAYSKLFFCF